MADLRQVHARIERAGVHLQTLRDEVAAYVDGPPYSIEKSNDRATMTCIERAVMRMDPPLSIALVFSDVAHQLRSALDNLVGALRVGGPSHMSEFPVRVSEDGFPACGAGVLQGVPEWAWQAIKEVQPFADRYTVGAAYGSGLRTLHDLARKDRHRAPRTYGAVLAPGPAYRAGGREVEFRGDGRTWASTTWGADAQVEPSWTVEVRFADNGIEGADRMQVTDVATHLHSQVHGAVQYIQRVEHRSKA